jgi:hypothetical protein
MAGCVAGWHYSDRAILVATTRRARGAPLNQERSLGSNAEVWRARGVLPGSDRISVTVQAGSDGATRPGAEVHRRAQARLSVTVQAGGDGATRAGAGVRRRARAGFRWRFKQAATERRDPEPRYAAGPGPDFGDGSGRRRRNGESRSRDAPPGPGRVSVAVQTGGDGVARPGAEVHRRAQARLSVTVQASSDGVTRAGAEVCCRCGRGRAVGGGRGAPGTPGRCMVGTVPAPAPGVGAVPAPVPVVTAVCGCAKRRTRLSVEVARPSGAVRGQSRADGAGHVGTGHVSVTSFPFVSATVAVRSDPDRSSCDSSVAFSCSAQAPESCSRSCWWWVRRFAWVP